MQCNAFCFVYEKEHLKKSLLFLFGIFIHSSFLTLFLLFFLVGLFGVLTSCLTADRVFYRIMFQDLTRLYQSVNERLRSSGLGCVSPIPGSGHPVRGQPIQGPGPDSRLHSHVHHECSSPQNHSGSGTCQQQVLLSRTGSDLPGAGAPDYDRSDGYSYRQPGPVHVQTWRESV